ncbi:MAG: hypothetical protein KJZ58_13955 [Flavobacteriales bacterium]|nr:hypothetical protein [Flavobacteriales bacterium]
MGEPEDLSSAQVEFASRSEASPKRKAWRDRLFILEAVVEQRIQKTNRMKHVFSTLSALALLASASVQAQTFDASQVEFWVGSG